MAVEREKVVRVEKIFSGCGGVSTVLMLDSRSFTVKTSRLEAVGLKQGSRLKIRREGKSRFSVNFAGEQLTTFSGQPQSWIYPNRGPWPPFFQNFKRF